MQVFSLSAALVGVCLTGIGVLQVIASQTKLSSVADEVLAGDALLFMATCMLSFWSFKTRQQRRRRMLRVTVDVIFNIALLLMVIVCAMVTWVVT